VRKLSKQEREARGDIADVLAQRALPAPQTPMPYGEVPLPPERPPDPGWRGLPMSRNFEDRRGEPTWPHYLGMLTAPWQESWDIGERLRYRAGREQQRDIDAQTVDPYGLGASVEAYVQSPEFRNTPRRGFFDNPVYEDPDPDSMTWGVP
jgi:hypothetical protein